MGKPHERTTNRASRTNQTELIPRTQNLKLFPSVWRCTKDLDSPRWSIAGTASQGHCCRYTARDKIRSRNQPARPDMHKGWRCNHKPAPCTDAHASCCADSVQQQISLILEKIVYTLKVLTQFNLTQAWAGAIQSCCVSYGSSHIQTVQGPYS